MKNLVVLLIFFFSLLANGCSADSKTEKIPEKNNFSTESEEKILFDFENKIVTLNNGYKMPIFGLGTYSLNGDICKNSIKTALSHGVRLFDTAHFYGNEIEVGEAIRESDIPREEIFVVTKLYPNQFENPEAAIEESLQKLNIGYVDMMLLHHPGKNDVETYEVIEKYISEGKIHSVGLSNWYIEELNNFLPQVKTKPALVQNEIHPYYQENEVVQFIQSLGIVVQGWYPLGGRGFNKELLSEPVLQKIADTSNKNFFSFNFNLWNLRIDEQKFFQIYVFGGKIFFLWTSAKI